MRPAYLDELGLFQSCLLLFRARKSLRFVPAMPRPLALTLRPGGVVGVLISISDGAPGTTLAELTNDQHVKQDMRSADTPLPVETCWK
jgi:hypothetical protein